MSEEAERNAARFQRLSEHLAVALRKIADGVDDPVAVATKALAAKVTS